MEGRAIDLERTDGGTIAHTTGRMNEEWVVRKTDEQNDGRTDRHGENGRTDRHGGYGRTDRHGGKGRTERTVGRTKERTDKLTN